MQLITSKINGHIWLCRSDIIFSSLVKNCFFSCRDHSSECSWCSPIICCLLRSCVFSTRYFCVERNCDLITTCRINFVTRNIRNTTSSTCTSQCGVASEEVAFWNASLVSTVFCTSKQHFIAAHGASWEIRIGGWAVGKSLSWGMFVWPMFEASVSKGRDVSSKATYLVIMTFPEEVRHLKPLW